jgi:hypothetical protein
MHDRETLIGRIELTVGRVAPFGLLLPVFALTQIRPSVRPI